MIPHDDIKESHPIMHEPRHSSEYAILPSHFFVNKRKVIAMKPIRLILARLQERQKDPMNCIGRPKVTKEKDKMT